MPDDGPRRVLLLIPTTSYRTPDFMKAAGRLGLDVVVGTDRDQPLGALTGRTITVHYHDPERGAEDIVRFADRYPLTAVVAVDDPGTVLAAAASERLDLPHNAPDAVEAARNKAVLRERLVGAGILSPYFRIARFADDVAEVARRLPYPVVIKPLSLSGSRGVMRADNVLEFQAAVERLAAILRRPAVAEECAGTADRYLIESFLPGDEVAVEALLQEGELLPLAVFDKPDPLDGPFFEETIYVTPSRLPEDQQRAIVQTTAEAARALGLRDGPVHAELRLNADGIWPVDIAARTIGGLCARTLSFGSGISLEEIVLQHAIRAPIETINREAAAAGVMMIPIPQAGTLHAIEGKDEAEAVPGIVEIDIAIHRGSVLVPLPEGADYLGFIFAKGETPEAVESSLRAAHAALRFQIGDDATARPASPGNRSLV